MKINFTEEQMKIITEAVDWYFNSSEQIYQFSGPPGTGKSLVMNEIITRIRQKRPINVAPMAYTGAAAIVMRMKGQPEAKTIHSWLYKVVEVPVVDSFGNPIMDTYFDTPIMKTEFVPNTEELSKIGLIAIDEGFMVPIEMRDHILNTGKKVLVAGDINQIPPVMSSPAFLVDGNVRILKTIMRQAEQSAIVYLSQRALHGLPLHTGYYGDSIVVQKHELTKEMLLYANTILACTNKTKEEYNTMFRERILHLSGLLPHQGEKLICRRNNWTIESGGINLTNGMSGIVINEPDIRSMVDSKIFKIDFNPILTNTPFFQIGVDYDYFTAPYDKKRSLNSYASSKSANRFDFGYAQTVHTAQGSQWATGVFIQEPMRNSNQINYTAISRFSHNCIIAIPNGKYYTGGY